MEFLVSPYLFSMEGVEHLSKMEHLKYLFINVAEGDTDDVLQILVHSAGKVPHLQKFDFDDMLRSNSKFIQLYGQNYPDKKLHINMVR